MINLFIYPNAKKPFETFTDKHLSFLKNTTIFSEEGLKKHCNLTSPENADYFYMGQISCGTYTEFNENNFKYLKGNEAKHIVELEGDWLYKSIPEWLLNCLCMGNADRTYYKSRLFFVRPCMSKLLVHLAKNDIKSSFKPPDKISFGFIGQHDPRGTRFKLYRLLTNNNINNEIYFNDRWCSQIDLKKENYVVQNFAGVLERNILSLCPRGAGEDSSRFYETCFFGRVPVLVSHCKILDEDRIIKPFYFRISPDLTDEEMLLELNKIAETEISVLIDMGNNAKEYFNKNVKSYFKDPTEYFLNYLKSKGV